MSETTHLLHKEHPVTNLDLTYIERAATQAGADLTTTTKAAEAIQQRLRWPSAHWGAESIHPDAIPHIAAAAAKAAEEHIREMVSQEILRAIVPIQPVGTMHEGENRGLRLAAQIAKGPQQ